MAINLPITVPMTIAEDPQRISFDVSSDEALAFGLGITVTTISGEHYTGIYEVTPRADEAVILETSGFVMDDNVTVNAVQTGELIQSEMFEVPQFIQVDNAGLITAVGNGQDTVFPVSSSGWLNAGENGVTLYLYGEATKQLPTQPATVVTPNATRQTVVPAGKFTTGSIIVEPIPENYGLITWDGSTLTVS